jgi:hypothetical protein
MLLPALHPYTSEFVLKVLEDPLNSFMKKTKIRLFSICVAQGFIDMRNKNEEPSRCTRFAFRFHSGTKHGATLLHYM